MGLVDSAINALKQAAEAGFVCGPRMLEADAWLGSVRKHPGFASLLANAEDLAEQARSIVATRMLPA